MKLDLQLSPFLVFINLLDDIVQHVCKSWRGVIRGFDAELSVKVSNVR
jgi:hypothetical protein